MIVLALSGTSLVRVPCPVCGGTGRFSLTAYPLTRSYRGTFVSTIVSRRQIGSGDWVTINGRNVQVCSKE